MSVAVVLPAGSYRVSDTEVALLLLLPAQDTFNSVLKSFSALTTNHHLDRHVVIYH